MTSVHIVFMENGTIHSVHKKQNTACEMKSRLEKLYENATVKKFEVIR